MGDWPEIDHGSRFALTENLNVEHTRRITKAIQVADGKDLSSSASVELASVDNKGEQDTVQYNGTPQSKSKSQNLANSKSPGSLEVLASWQIVFQRYTYWIRKYRLAMQPYNGTRSQHLKPEPCNLSAK